MNLKTIFFLLLFFLTVTINAQINYSNLNYWAAHPLKKDWSDSIPKPLQQRFTTDTTFDVFFIHPTTYTNNEKQFGQNADINDEELNNYTDERTIKNQASIFNVANVYAPRYLQAHISSYYPKNLEEISIGKQALDSAYQTVKQAFQSYLKHWNNNKPIIIASHSQGTTHAKRLVKEFFDGTPLQKKLVAAYLVGIPVEKNWFTYISACTTPVQIGCICSWRTVKEGHLEPYMKKEADTSIIVTNPITFDASKPTAVRAENKGTILKKFDKVVYNVVGATINNNVIETEKPKFFGNFLFSTKNYHVVDYNLFYVNIKENVKARMERFKAWD